MASTSPPEALHTLVERCRLPLAVSAEVETLTAGFLAEDLIVPAARDAGPRARINGYALSPDFAGGRCRFESRAVEEVATRFLPDDRREDIGDRAGAGLPEAVRLESGDSIPQGFDRILAVRSAVVCGPGVVEISPEDIPASGEGIETVGAEFELSAGTRLDVRLRSVLLARGLGAVAVRPRGGVAVATLGERLIDPAAIGTIEAEGELRADLTGYWLPDALRAMGHRTRSLGMLSPDPPGVLKALRRAQRGGLSTAILCGGLGDGIADRTIEILQTGPFRIHFSEVEMDPGRRFLFAQGMGLDVLVLGGAPLDAAIGFDLFVAPLLLRGAGAPPELWDWSAGGPETLDRSGDERSWQVRPCAKAPTWPPSGADSTPGGGREEAPPPSRLSPRLPGPAGWLVVSPAGEVAYYCPVSV